MFVSKLPTMLLVLSVFPIKKHIIVKFLSLIPFRVILTQEFWTQFDVIAINQLEKIDLATRVS